MSTAVLIVNYRGYDDLERCLGSLEPHLGLDDDVVIVDWESDRKALRRAAGRWPLSTVSAPVPAGRRSALSDRRIRRPRSPLMSAFRP